MSQWKSIHNFGKHEKPRHILGRTGAKQFRPFPMVFVFSVLRVVTTCFSYPSFLLWSYNNFAAQLFFSSGPVLDVASWFAAALNIQLVSSVSDVSFG